MTLTNLFIRFFAYYLLAIVAASVAVQILGIKMSLNIPILVGVVMHLCQVYIIKNKRLTNKAEETKIIIGFITLNLAVQILLTAPYIMSGSFDMNTLITGITIAGALHAIGILAIVKFTRKNMSKQGFSD